MNYTLSLFYFITDKDKIKKELIEYKKNKSNEINIYCDQ